LYGKAVGVFQSMFDKVSQGLPVVALQFARIVRDGGEVYFIYFLVLLCWLSSMVVYGFDGVHVFL